MNADIRDKSRYIDAELRDLRARLADVNQQIANIIDAIAKGYDQPSFHARVEELELNKAKLENLILDLSLTVGVREYDFHIDHKNHILKSKKEPVTVTVEQLQQLSSSLQAHITQTNLPEIKTFLSNFIESVVVNVETVDLNIFIKAKYRKDSCSGKKSASIYIPLSPVGTGFETFGLLRCLTYRKHLQRKWFQVAFGLSGQSKLAVKARQPPNDELDDCLCKTIMN